MICPTCGEEVVAILCRPQGKATPESEAALAAIIQAMHDKLAGHTTEGGYQ